MHRDVVEVKQGVLEDFDGHRHEVQGGAWLPPDGYLTASAELEALRRKQAEEGAGLLVGLVAGAALVGLACGWWLGRRPTRRRFAVR